MPSDFKLDPITHDIDLSSDGVQTFTINTEVVAQRIKIALLLRAGEWFADISKGIPYLQFLQAKDSKSLADSVLSEAIIGVEEVEELVTYTSDLDTNRALQVQFSVRTTDGEIIDLFVEV